MFFRRLAVFVVAAAVVVGPLPAVASAAEDYRAPVKIAFPAVATATYSNDFWNPRSGGRVHRATDLFAPAGTPIYAAKAGTVIWLPREESGNAGFAIQIRGVDGRVYAYYHLGKAGGRFRRAVDRSVTLNGQVARGQLIGWLGDSGNAADGAPHLHFEIQDDAVVDPYGSNRRNPYNSLRQAQGLPLDWTQPVVSAPAASGALRLGARGPAVQKWQRRLNRSKRAGSVTVDGVFGPGTHNATVAFQKSVGLGPDGLGVVGPKTRKAMKSVLAALRTATPPSPRPPAPSTSTSTTTTQSSAILRLGSSGKRVKKWQRKLNRSGRVARVTVDGDFGPATHRATVTFQRSAGLGPSGLGVVGPRTRAAMRKVLAAR